MPNIDLSILNQRQTPAFYADVFANRPAAGFVGRIFISTNTFAFYRDNGTSWDLIGGPGTGTVTGTGANGQVTFWNGASTITGSNDLFWDATNGHLGINTNAPGTALDVHHDQNTVAILNQTTATNDVRIGFQNNGVGLWRIGAFYNAGANDFGIFDAVGNIQPVTVKKTTGQVLIGTSTVGSGKLVVASATGDNGIQIVGATAPSLRIDSAESGPTKRAGLGISTATNNFIQGSTDRDFCMFNGSTTASPILFGIYDAAAVNVQEAARISAARNFLIGTTTDGGQKLQVNGGARATGYYLDNMTAGSGALYYNLAENRVTLANYNANGILNFEVNGGSSAMTINANGQLGLGVTSSAWGSQAKSIQLNAQSLIAGMTFSSTNNQTLVGNNVYVGADTNFKYIANNPAALYRISNSGSMQWFNAPSGTAGNDISFTQAMTLDESGQLGLGVTPSAWSPTLVKAIQIGNLGTSISSYTTSNTSTPYTFIDNNAYYNGTNFIYIVNNRGAARYQQVNNEHRWEIAPSGTAGSSISFTQAMTLPSTGNLLIGTTTDAGQKLQVNGGANFAGELIITGNYAIRLDSVTGTYSQQLQFRNNNTNKFQLYLDTATNNFSIFNTVLSSNNFTVKASGVINIQNVPTSSAGLSSGDIYSNAGILTIVP